MIEQRIQNVSRFVQKAAAPELFMLRMIGGKGLSTLASEIYTGFGTFPGQEEQLTKYLTRLPMKIVEDAPTFVYTKDGQTRPFLESTQRYSPNSITETMFVLKNERWVELGFKKSRTLLWFVRGAERLHRAVHISQERKELYSHILRLSKDTALLLGLPVNGV